MKLYFATLAATIVFILATPSLISAGTLPNITGTWYANGDRSLRCTISQSGTSVTLTNEQGKTARGTFLDPSTLDTDWGYMGGRHIRGVISQDLRRISWSNGTSWSRGSGSYTPPPPTPEPTPTPERLNVSVRVENNESSPIYVHVATLKNGYGRSYAQCVSFRNVSTKVATDVDFSFVVTSHSGRVEADFGQVDRGTFTPPVSIDDHCWQGRLWSDRVVRLMARETVLVKRVTFADATTWRPGMPFLRGYANNATPLAHPIEQHPQPTEAPQTPETPEP